jgi:hypothetical protein
LSEHLLPTALPATDVRGGFVTLLYKETLRFWKVSMQTVFAPVVTTVLYLMIFAHVLANHVEVFPGVAYSSFLVPGLAMMAALQNAFANTSSSMIQSKMTGNLVFILLPPLSPAEIVGAYVLASMLRGFLSGRGVSEAKIDEMAASWMTAESVAAIFVDLLVDRDPQRTDTAIGLWPGQPMTAHWGVPDPGAFVGSEEDTAKVFWDAALILKRRIELMLSLPLASLDRLSLQKTLRDIGTH